MRVNGISARVNSTDGIKLPPKQQYTHWGLMTDQELIAEGSRQCQEKGIPSKNQTKDRLSGLFRAIQKRDNSSEIWRQIVFASNFQPKVSLVPLEEGIVTQPSIEMKQSTTQLVGSNQDISSPQFLVLKRKFEKRPTEIYGGWKFKSTEQILPIANDFVKQEGISSMQELKKTDKGLWRVIKKRGLQEKIEFAPKNEPEPASGIITRKERHIQKPKERRTQNEMFRLIAEKFKLGSGKAYLGSNRIGLENIHDNSLSKQEYRLFDRAMRLLIREGAIILSPSGNAASFNIKNLNEEIRRVIEDLIQREMSVR